MSNVIDLKVITRSEKDYHDKKVMELTIIEQEKEIKDLNKTIAEKNYRIKELENELRKRELRWLNGNISCRSNPL